MAEAPAKLNIHGAQIIDRAEYRTEVAMGQIS
jgi:hypothetical protein